MDVLVACEFSATVRDQFLDRGHSACSCDLLPCDKGGPHYQMDINRLLDESGHWDLIIAHPDCTKLTVAGNSTYGECKPRYPERLAACAWTKALWEKCKLKADRVCFENPVSVLRRLAGMPKPSYVHPWQFGHLEQKKTCLFLHNLEPLKPTHIVYDEMMLLPKNQRERLHYLPPSPDRWKIRSTTFAGVAAAMADQWGK